MHSEGYCHHTCEVHRYELNQLEARVGELEQFTEYLVDYINTNLQQKEGPIA